jgi:hypothetical protein
MAILVYGTCAIVVPAGLIGTARQRSHGVTPPAERISRPPLTFR